LYYFWLRSCAPERFHRPQLRLPLASRSKLGTTHTTLTAHITGVMERACIGSPAIGATVITIATGSTVITRPDTTATTPRHTDIGITKISIRHRQEGAVIFDGCRALNGDVMVRSGQPAAIHFKLADEIDPSDSLRSLCSF